MIIAWIRFGFTAFFMISGMFFFVSAALGANRRGFGLVLQRMHAASLGDTMGLMLSSLGVICAMGVDMSTVKILFILFFMWCTSPVSSHLLAQVEYYTSDKAREVK